MDESDVANNGETTGAEALDPHQQCSSAAAVTQDNGNAIIAAPAKRPGGITGKGFMPGRSGNPNGRPKSRPLTEGLTLLLERKLAPEHLQVLTHRLGPGLSARATYGDAMALLMVQVALGLDHRGSIEAFREIADRVEGRPTQRVEVAPEQPLSEEEIQYRLWGYLIRLAVERGKGFNMPLPALTVLADQAGIDLGIPREEKPSSDGKPMYPEGPGTFHEAPQKPHKGTLAHPSGPHRPFPQFTPTLRGIGYKAPVLSGPTIRLESPPVAAQAEIRVGTSAFTAAGWESAFYPAGMKPTDYLTYYATHFDTVAVDSTAFRTFESARLFE